MKKRAKIPALHFNVVVNGAPVDVVAVPFITANEKTRFRVSYNGSPIHIFGLDDAAQKVAVLDSASETIPMPVERAIGEALLHKLAA